MVVVEGDLLTLVMEPVDQVAVELVENQQELLELLI
jgi:hypothetical protein